MPGNPPRRCRLKRRGLFYATTPLYECLALWIKILECGRPHRDTLHNIVPEDGVPHFFLFRLGAYGRRISRVLHKTGWSTVVSRGVLFSVLWWILTDGNVQSWWIGVPAVSFAVIASTALLPPISLVWWELLKFVPFFLWRSLLGGADVAWRAIHPGMPIAPAVVDYPLELLPGLPQVMLVGIVSLLPGTLSAALDGQVLKVHVLDGGGAFMIELKTLEQRVARMCGASLTTSHGGV